ncbi:MAG TPA: FAD-dependent oxidoreductase, partial [Candidatus Hodarchaeales archaeon]|nr:FAD-dependent oxidoreductase [Candidatus Hodarchaeales archaeon]
NFRDWIYATFGKGIAELFMLPYNFKVWGYPAEKLSYQWIGERVAVTDLKRVAENILFEKNDVSWGPNNRFRFPLRGGTGEIWKRLFQRIEKNRTFFEHELQHVDTQNRYVLFTNGHREDYDVLISTIPLKSLISLSDLQNKRIADKLIYSSIHIVGVGLKGTAPEHLRTKTWMYFPGDDSPFFRVTVFSNYSPNNVPDSSKFWSLMSEVSESPQKPIDHEKIAEQAIQGMLNTKLIRSREDIVNVWHKYQPYGYPTPSLERDEALSVLEELDRRNVYSRGRFGAWKYEVSNQDHSLMQGVEAVNKVLLHQKEITVWNPQKANAGKN